MAGKANLRRLVSHGLVSEGFQRLGRTHIKRVDEEFAYLVDVGPLGQQETVSPWIGFRSNSVEHTLAELRECEHDEYSATLSVNVGYVLTGQFVTWQPPSDAQDILRSVSDGLARFKPYLKLERIAAALNDIPAASASPLHFYHLAIAYMISKKFDAASKALKAGQAEYCRYDDEVCTDFLSFERKALERMQSSTD